MLSSMSSTMNALGTIQPLALFPIVVWSASNMFTSLVVTRGLCKYFTAINNTNEKLYGLKRGKDFVPENLENAEETEEEVKEITAPAGDTEGAQA